MAHAPMLLAVVQRLLSALQMAHRELNDLKELYAECAADEWCRAGECLPRCALGEVTLGGSLGACLDATCPELASELGACAQPILETGSCDDGLSACGLMR